MHILFMLFLLYCHQVYNIGRLSYKFADSKFGFSFRVLRKYATHTALNCGVLNLVLIRTLLSVAIHVLF